MPTGRQNGGRNGRSSAREAPETEKSTGVSIFNGSFFSVGGEESARSGALAAGSQAKRQKGSRPQRPARSDSTASRWLTSAPPQDGGERFSLLEQGGSSASNGGVFGAFGSRLLWRDDLVAPLKQPQEPSSCCPAVKKGLFVAAATALFLVIWRTLGAPPSKDARTDRSSGAMLETGGEHVSTTRRIPVMRRRRVGPPKVPLVPARKGRWLTCAGAGNCGHKDLRRWKKPPSDLASEVEKDFNWLPGVWEEIWNPVAERWRKSPPSFGGSPVTLEDLAFFAFDLLQSDPFHTGDEVPFLDFNGEGDGKVVAVSQRQLAFLVVNALMGNSIDGGDGLTELMKRCSDKERHTDSWVWSLMSLLAVLSRELSQGDQGRMLIGATPRWLDQGEWRDHLESSHLKEPTICKRDGDDTGCDLADFMAGGNKGQALTDIAGGVVGGGAQLCTTADSQDESLVQFYSEVLAFSFFITPGGDSMLPVPWTLLGARRYMGDLTGQTMYGNCGRIRKENWLNDDILTHHVSVPVGAKSSTVYASAFVAVASVCSTCWAGDKCDYGKNVNNNCDSQRRHLDEDIVLWYAAYEPSVYLEEVQEAFRGVVKRIGTGPWGAGVWYGDSQQYFLMTWLATSLLSSGTLDYYIYDSFCENPGNQCFVIGREDCEKCIEKSGVQEIDSSRCGKTNIWDMVIRFKDKPAQELYDALLHLGTPPAQVFDAIFNDG